MKTSSAKAKGRSLQKWLASLLIETAVKCGITLTDRDIRSTSMGVGGPDIQMSERASIVYPFEFECKNETDPLAIYNRFDKFNDKHAGSCIAVFKRTNRSKSSAPMIVLPYDFILALSSDKFKQVALTTRTVSEKVRFNLYKAFETDTQALGKPLIVYQGSGDIGHIACLGESDFRLFLEDLIITRIDNGSLRRDTGSD